MQTDPKRDYLPRSPQVQQGNMLPVTLLDLLEDLAQMRDGPDMVAKHAQKAAPPCM